MAATRGEYRLWQMDDELARLRLKRDALQRELDAAPRGGGPVASFVQPPVKPAKPGPATTATEAPKKRRTAVELARMAAAESEPRVKAHLLDQLQQTLRKER